MLAELTGAPVTTTLMGIGAFPDSHPQHLGMPGMHGTVAAVTSLQKADLIVALGARFDDRVTGKLDSFAPHGQDRARRHRPRRDRQEPRRGRADRRRRPRGHRRPRGRRAGRAGTAERRGSAAAEAARAGTPDWWTPAEPLAGDLPARLRPARGRLALPAAGHPAHRRAGPGGHRLRRGRRASTRCGPRTSSTYEQPATWLNSGGLGTMGYAVPAALGAKVGMPERTVWAIDGDGCFQMTNQELVTAALNGVPDQGRDHQQRRAGHGPPVADPLLQPALLQHRAAQRPRGGRRQQPARAPASPTS